MNLHRGMGTLKENRTMKMEVRSDRSIYTKIEFQKLGREREEEKKERKKEERGRRPTQTKKRSLSFSSLVSFRFVSFPSATIADSSLSSLSLLVCCYLDRIVFAVGGALALDS